MKTCIRNVSIGVIATVAICVLTGCSWGNNGKHALLVPECTLVSGGTVTGAEYTDNATGVFPEGRIVTLGSFYMGIYEVTQEQYRYVMKGQKITVNGSKHTVDASPSKYTRDKDHANYPVECVTWFDAMYYCNVLSEKEKLEPCYTITVTEKDKGHITEATVDYDKTKNGYRLPTEEEWEYAARGGNPTKDDWNYTFSGANKAAGTSYRDDKNTGLDSVGWYCYNNDTGITGKERVSESAKGDGSHEVGLKKPNALGIWDMSGNVSEWCWNSGKPAERGGDWYNSAYWASVSSRHSPLSKTRSGNLGFRVVRNAN